MKRTFQTLAGRAFDAVENMMDGFNPERVYLDGRGAYNINIADGEVKGRLIAVGTIGSNNWDIHWVQTQSNLAVPDNRIEAALSTVEMMQRMDAVKRTLGEKTPDHYDNWLEHNARRLAKQGIAPTPALAV